MIKIITKKQYLQMQEEIEELNKQIDKQLEIIEHAILQLREKDEKIENQEKELRNGRTKWR